MCTRIRKMTPEDRPCVLEMMRRFYASPAVLSNGSDEIFAADVDSCIGDCPFIEGFSGGIVNGAT